MQQFKHIIKDPQGIHARPAGLLVNEAKKYESKVTIAKDGKEADARKLFAIMSLGVKANETIEIKVEGEDEEKAAASLKTFMEELW